MHQPNRSKRPKIKFEIQGKSIWGSGINSTISIGGLLAGIAVPLTQGTSNISIMIALTIGVIGLFTAYTPEK